VWFYKKWGFDWGTGVGLEGKERAGCRGRACVVERFVVNCVQKYRMSAVGKMGDIGNMYRTLAEQEG
jgi:hypothetical protein